MDYAQLHADLVAEGVDLASNTNDVQIAADFNALVSADLKDKVVTGNDLLETHGSQVNQMILALQELAATGTAPIAQALLDSLILGDGQNIGNTNVRTQIQSMVGLTAGQAVEFTQAYADLILGMATEYAPKYAPISAKDVAVVRRRYA